MGVFTLGGSGVAGAHSVAVQLYLFVPCHWLCVGVGLCSVVAWARLPSRRGPPVYYFGTTI